MLPLEATVAPIPLCPFGLPESELLPWAPPTCGPGGPMGPSSVLFFRKYFSSLANICFPYVYFFNVLQCGRI